MNTAFTIAVSVIVGLSLLFVILGLISSRISKTLQKLIAHKFKKEEMLGATTRANFFGIKSKGGAQVRGNGALVLTKDDLYFIRAVPQKEYKISISSIRNVTMPRFFNGKSAFVPLLCVNYDTEYGEDSIAWALKDVKMERTKTIVWDDPQKNKRDAVTSISGLEYLKAIKEHRISPPPVANLVGYKICEVEKGYAAFELNPAEYHYNPFATVHGGILSTLLDTAMTSSVLTTLPNGFSCTTIEIKVNFVRPVTAETGILKCEAQPIHVGKRLATVEGKMLDKNGRLHAHGVSTCSIFKIA